MENNRREETVEEKGIRLQVNWSQGDRAVAHYREKDKQVKKSARRDQRQYVERLAIEAETAAERKDMKTVYQITRKLRGDRGQNQDLSVEAKDTPAGETEQDLDIKHGPITVQEVRH